MNRDEFATCPRDQGALEASPDGTRHSCGSCKGVQLSEAAVSALLAELFHDAPRKLPFEPPRDEIEPLVCPHCTAAMTKHTLFTIHIDRCEAHGLWFDGDELQRVLENADLTRPPRPSFWRENSDVLFWLGWFAALIAGVAIGP